MKKEEDESSCKIVNSRGILKSCDIYSKTPKSSSIDSLIYIKDFLKNQQPNKSIYVCSENIYSFTKYILDDITVPFVLVSGDSDLSFGSELISPIFLYKLLSSKYLIAWFAQNYIPNKYIKLYSSIDCDSKNNENSHQKIAVNLNKQSSLNISYELLSDVLSIYSKTNKDNINTLINKINPLPIGLDYHTLSIYNIQSFGNTKYIHNHPWGYYLTPKEQETQLLRIFFDSIPSTKGHKIILNRKMLIYSNVQFNLDRWGDRQTALNVLTKKKLIYLEPNKLKRILTWKEMTKYRFVLSPFGNGFECHRTWEAIALGCIPIIKYDDVSHDLYKDLPVLIVKDWEDITIELLQTTSEKYKDFSLYYTLPEKATLDYWRKKISHFP